MPSRGMPKPIPSRSSSRSAPRNTARKVIVYIATSADGYIARPDGDVEWLNRRPHDYDYGMREL